MTRRPIVGFILFALLAILTATSHLIEKRAAAIAELTDANLQLREDPAEFTDTCQVGTVTAQEPPGVGAQ